MHVSWNQLCWAIFTLLTTARAVLVATADTVQIGPYYTQHCESKNNEISTALKTLVETLYAVISDLGSSPSSDAYTAFFKEVVYAPDVRQVFSFIVAGRSVSPEPGAVSAIPIFYCVDGRDQVTYKEGGRKIDAYDKCRDLSLRPLAIAFQRIPNMVLCPAFFSQPVAPVESPASCLTVDPHRNRYVQTGISLLRYQVWYLLHVLVGYYVYADHENTYDQYVVNACSALSGSSAILNTYNYVYYAANIRLGCTNFPTVRTRPPGRGSSAGVELLETDANLTAVAANESITLVVQNVSIEAVPPV